MTAKVTAPASESSADGQKVPEAAAWLGGLGLIPFIAGAFLVANTDASWASDVLRYYAAAILAFMGGVQWGLAMMDQRTVERPAFLWARLSFSVLPALIAWLALLLDGPYDLAAIAAAFALLLYSDLQAVQQGWAPAWYRRLRIPLTAIVITCLLIAAGMMAWRG